MLNSDVPVKSWPSAKRPAALPPLARTTPSLPIMAIEAAEPKSILS